MKKRILSILVAVSMMFSGTVFAAEAVPEASASAIEEDDPEDETIYDGVVIDLSKDDLEAVLDKLQKVDLTEEDLKNLREQLERLDLSEEDLNYYIDMIQNMDMNEIIGNISTISNVIQSEEFKHLMEYPEMQALAESASKKTVEMIMDDPALTGKILVTLGMDEKLVKVLVLFAGFIKKSDAYSDFVSVE